MRRSLAIAFVLGAGAASAIAVGSGSVTATPEVAVIAVAGSGGSGSALLANTTSSTIDVQLAPDVSCEPDVTFSAAGSDAVALGPGSNQVLALACDSKQPFGIERCLVHATDATTGDALADVLAVCEDAPGTDLAVSPPSLTFGTVAVGSAAAQAITVTNTGSAVVATLFLQTDDLGGDYVMSAPCNPDAPYCDGYVSALAPGSSASIVVSCAPTSTGGHAAQLAIATDTGERASVALACTGAAAGGPAIGISPATVDVVAPVEVVSGSAQAIVRLANLGDGVAQVTDARVVDVVSGAAADWTYDVAGACTVLPCSLSAGAEVDLVIAFDPSAIARRDASLIVSYQQDAVEQSRSIPLYGVGQGATLAQLGSGALSFGDVPIGHASSLAFQLVNRGNRDTTAVLAAAPTGAIAPAEPSITVSPTMPAAVTVTCAPAAAGSGSATITAQSADTLTAGAVAIAATCTGIATPLYAEPSGIALGELQAGAAPQTFTIAIESTGAPLTLASAALDGFDPNVALGALSSSTTPATITVTVAPTAAETIATHLVVQDTAGAGDAIRVPITGTVAQAAVAATTTLDVGTFCVGQPTATATVAFANTGSASLEVAAPAGSAGAPFQVAFDAPTVYPASLAPGDTAIVAVTPLRQAAPTTLADTITWSTGDLAQPTATTAITAEFIGSGGAISPPLLDFGDVPVHLYTNDGQRVIVQNCNNTPLDLDTPTFESPFTIDGPNPPSSLAPNEAVAFSIGFHPTSLGTFAQQLTISSPELTQQLHVGLFGNGISTTPPTPDAGTGSSAPGETSFYACNAGASGAGAWPIALALLTLRRRRGSSSAR